MRVEGPGGFSGGMWVPECYDSAGVKIQYGIFKEAYYKTHGKHPHVVNLGVVVYAVSCYLPDSF